MNREEIEFELEMLTPYMNYLKEKINQALRIQRRAEFGKQPDLCYPGEEGHFRTLQEIPQDEEIVVFRQPGEIVNGIYTVVDKLPTEAERLEKVRQELAMIKYGASFDSDGNKL